MPLLLLNLCSSSGGKESCSSCTPSRAGAEAAPSSRVAGSTEDAGNFRSHGSTCLARGDKIP